VTAAERLRQQEAIRAESDVLKSVAAQAVHQARVAVGIATVMVAVCTDVLQANREARFARERRK
jgi:hypothetical protein